VIMAAIGIRIIGDIQAMDTTSLKRRAVV